MPGMNELKPIEPLILTLRGQRVILDADLAEVYGVETRTLNQAVKRKAERFPIDFIFQLSSDEWKNLKSQSVTSSSEDAENQESESNRPSSVTGSHGGRRKLPFAFTEHGAIMAASILNSPEAVAMSVFVVRAFVQMRETLRSMRISSSGWPRSIRRCWSMTRRCG